MGRGCASAGLEYDRWPMNYLKRLRGAIGPAKVILVYTTAIVRDDAGRVLLQRRTDFEADAWSLPGGMLELGETLGDCVRREVREETGYDTCVTRLIGLQSSPKWDVYYPNGDESQQWSAIFDCQVIGEPGPADPNETAALAWFEPDALPAVCRPWYSAALADSRRNGPATFDAPRPGHTPSDGSYIMDLRRRFGAGFLITPGSAAIILNDERQVLLIQRADNGNWAYPGGYMDLGESAAETAIREAYEESGVVCEPLHLVGVHTGPDHQVMYANGDQTQFAGAVFRCRYVGGEPRADGVETLQAGWFPIDARTLPEPMHPRVRQRLMEALSFQTEAYFQ